MKLVKSGILLLILFVTSASTIVAQNIISAEELAEIFNKENVQVIWAGSEAGCRIHIKDAINMPYNELCNHK